MENELIKCAIELSEKWKGFFGLHTQYVGYLTPEMALALMQIWREWDEDAELTEYESAELQQVINNRIEQIYINEGPNLKPRFSLQNDEAEVLKKLFSVLEKFDLWVDETTWNSFSNYLRTKTRKR